MTPHANATDAPRRPFGRRLARAAGVAVLVAAGLGGLVVVARTALVGMVIQGELASRGLPDAEFSVAGVGLEGTRIEDIRLGPDLSIAAVSVSYTLSGLSRGRIERIEISGLDVDVSAPDAGALGALREAMAAGGGPGGPALPSIRVAGARLHAATAAGAFSARLDGTVRPDLSAVFAVVIDEARAGIGGHVLRLQGLSADVVVDAGGKGGRATITGGSLGHGAPTPLFSPLAFSGTVAFDGTRATFTAAATGADGRMRLGLSGSHDLARNRGTAAFTLAPVRFAADGLQPGDLVPLAAAAGGVSGTVAARGSLAWEDGDVDVAADADLSGLAFTVKGVAVTDLSAALHLAARAADGPTVDIRRGRARIGVSGEELDLGDVEARLTLGADRGGLTVDLARATLRHRGAPSWFAPVEVRGTGRLRGTVLAFRAEAAARGGRARITAKGRHDLAEGGGTASLTLAPVTFARGGLQPDDLVPAAAVPGPVSGTVSGGATLTWDGDGLSGEARAEVDGLSLAAGGFALEDLSARLSAAHVRPGAAFSVDVGRARASLAVAGHGFRVADVRATLTVDPEAGALGIAVTGATLRHAAARPWFAPLGLSGEAHLRRGALAFRARLAVPAGGGGDITVSGRHDLADGSGKASVRLAAVNFRASGPRPADMVPALDVLGEVTGTVEGDMDLEWSEAGADGRARLALDGLSFATDTIAVEGLSGALTLDRLNPPRASAVQTLRARRIVAAVPFEAPVLRFRFETAHGGGRFHIEHAGAGIAGGLLSVTGAVIDSTAEANRMTIRLSGIDLGKLMDMLELEGISGSGVLSGAVPLEFRGETVLVTDGLLEAEGPGVLRFRSQPAKRVLAAGGEQAVLLLSVLEDFRYKRLSLSIDKAAAGDTVIRLSTEGHNPAVRDGQPFILNINLSGNLDRVFAAVLEGYRLSDRAIRATVGSGRWTRRKE